MKSRCIKCFQVISIPTRFTIFEALKKAPSNKLLTISDLVKLTNLTQPTITFHVNQLQKSGLIKKVKSGRQVFCHLTPHCSDCVLFSD